MFIVYVGCTHGWWWAATKLSIRTLHRLAQARRAPEGSILLSHMSTAAPLSGRSKKAAGQSEYRVRANPVYAGNDEETPDDQREQSSHHIKASKIQEL